MESTSTGLGQSIRAHRKSLGYSLKTIAARIGCRRQTLADLEAGKNVGVHTLMAVLAVLDKGLLVADKRPDLDRLREIFDEPEG
jgi:transcriptional regulator with XRE-family HTH domain